MKQKLRWLSPLVTLAALVVAGWALLAYEREYLWKVQELNLFLDTPLFLRQQMVTSGWLLTYAGTWLTEFLYHPVTGVGLLCALWAVFVAVGSRALAVPLKWTALLLVPVGALLLTVVTPGYWIYYLKLRGFFFAATIGATVAVGAAWLFRVVGRRYFLRPLFMVVSTAVLYPLVGAYGLLATLLMVVLAWRVDGEALAGRIACTVAGLAAVGFWPLFYYNHVFCQTSLEDIYRTGLPLFVINKEYAAYYTPYYILAGSLLLLAALYRRGRPSAVGRPLAWAAAHVVVVAALAYGVSRYWFRDYNFHKELRMQRAVEQEDWGEVLAEAATGSEEPTRAIVMMKNLALFRLGRQGDEMYHYRTGAKQSAAPFPLSMTQVVGRTIYYNYGQLNYCYRWCLEDGVEFGWRAEYLKYLTRCSLLNGEDRVARKYINLLKHTRYHREWAERYEPLVGHPELIAKREEFQPVRHLMKSDDLLGSDNSLVERFLMSQFIYADSDDRLYQEQALLAALWMKDIQMFWPRFFQYATSHPDQHMPVHFQEAAYLYGHLEHQVDISRMPFDESVRKTYDDFMAMAQQCAGMTEDQMRQVFYPRFGHTFYYEYYLVRNQRLY